MSDLPVGQHPPLRVAAAIERREGAAQARRVRELAHADQKADRDQDRKAEDRLVEADRELTERRVDGIEARLQLAFQLLHAGPVLDKLRLGCHKRRLLLLQRLALPRDQPLVVLPESANVLLQLDEELALLRIGPPERGVFGDAGLEAGLEPIHLLLERAGVDQQGFGASDCQQRPDHLGLEHIAVALDLASDVLQDPAAEALVTVKPGAGVDLWHLLSGHLLHAHLLGQGRVPFGHRQVARKRAQELTQLVRPAADERPQTPEALMRAPERVDPGFPLLDLDFGPAQALRQDEQLVLDRDVGSRTRKRKKAVKVSSQKSVLRKLF
jgi:hypothetical protein